MLGLGGHADDLLRCLNERRNFGRGQMFSGTALPPEAAGASEGCEDEVTVAISANV